MESDWIEHRRADDGEHVGWMKPVDDGFVAIDLLGRPRTETVDWLSAEVTPSAVRVKKEDWGDMTAPQIYFTVSLPITEDQLRPLSPNQET